MAELELDSVDRLGILLAELPSRDEWLELMANSSELDDNELAASVRDDPWPEALDEVFALSEEPTVELSNDEWDVELTLIDDCDFGISEDELVRELGMASDELLNGVSLDVLEKPELVCVTILVLEE